MRDPRPQALLRSRDTWPTPRIDLTLGERDLADGREQGPPVLLFKRGGIAWKQLA
jgi:hypothetical protein